jgi:excisionase family DNA binding protein
VRSAVAVLAVLFGLRFPRWFTGLPIRGTILNDILTDVKNVRYKSVVATYTTTEAAKAAGISRVTLQTWISTGDVRAPRVQLVAGRAKRLWSEADVERLRRKREKIFRKKIRK